MRTMLTANVAVAMLIACSDEKPSSAQPLPAVTVPTTASAGVADVVAAAWPKAIQACPGLVKFATDLSFVGVEDNYSVAPPHARRIDVKFKVAESPKQVPAEYRAFGHTCFFSLSPDGTKLSIAKTACASICLDSASSSSGGDLTVGLK